MISVMMPLRLRMLLLLAYLRATSLFASSLRITLPSGAPWSLSKSLIQRSAQRTISSSLYSEDSIMISSEVSRPVSQSGPSAVKKSQTDEVSTSEESMSFL